MSDDIDRHTNTSMRQLHAKVDALTAKVDALLAIAGVDKGAAIEVAGSVAVALRAAFNVKPNDGPDEG